MIGSVFSRERQAAHTKAEIREAVRREGESALAWTQLARTEDDVRVQARQRDRGVEAHARRGARDNLRPRDDDDNDRGSRVE